MESQKEHRLLGCDISEAGLDYNVATVVFEKEGTYTVEDIDFWHNPDTMVTAGKIKAICDKFNIEQVNVDATGPGKGVADRLIEMGVNCQAVKVGTAPDREPYRFLNHKAQYYWKLRTLFEEKRIILKKIPNREKLVHELSLMKYELTSSEKVKIVDPTKSPDFADSLMLACSGKEQFIFDF